jgi:hypothetical protein
MSRLVVATLYQLGRANGKFTKEQKTVLRENVKVDEEHVLDVNFEHETSGRFYVIDEKATEENEKQRQINQQRKAQENAARALNPLELVNAMVSKATATEKAPAKVELTDEEKAEKARLAEEKKAEAEAKKAEKDAKKPVKKPAVKGPRKTLPPTE